ncbi:DNA polymerase III subunit gamma/tau [Clostridium pasteurianum DSM 525 = ATCC 6013]|uniref:DNA-directed DNA polymerase n=1 Tax=Clostridium pasteurianum DSM 525 = ATCC 6013 TaxID=1262449 RepID=A0A0H3J2N8_CLOPA|nr:DNA polymerase III subunit gamma/tau [Clostridium pasteurianum]AJA46173.1 DNA polymerase III subunit gamma/tau [Clostridium pasteurianum DSM 525 = ATCC 6013]AJA50161.1 DNA polymerase III subunit gamma/tau [Clostridium pasteurianum DSM 525 = ATCC 6013]AOZ73633.1 DNA polymerase III subunit gamma/tau [Clostridium pasteurianum DSM 525 = ATCC 6013]AOZ77430.1 DNA polymerase III subunit gamma/tau [Clostridium pasteurianum]ELP57763.1 DNA polymerase III subunits gamma and tau [Clostridium pasteurian
MGYTALYREWRPRTFEDVVGQKHVTITLKNQVKDNRIAHAYLLCGTRGTGKTSTAKILSKAVNCLNPRDGEPCNQCEMCKKINNGLSIDVTELDAASHNGVEDIRNIIDDVQYPPHEARFKVYIIDEVHMLSMGAVNAFLKTLEEPPKNVIFILATTDPQRLPITILSRCQRFDFKRIKKDDMFYRLREIVTNQGIFADDRSLNLIARISDGAMRDALSILDQAISTGNGKVQYDDIINMLGLVTNEYLIKITSELIEKNIENAMKIIDDVVISGKDINIFIKDLTIHMRNLMMVKISKNAQDILDMSQENIKLIKDQSEKIRVEEIMRYIKILQDTEEESKWSKQSRIYLELAIIKMCKIEYDTSNEIILSRLNKLENMMKSGHLVYNKEVKINNIKDDIKKQPLKINGDNASVKLEDGFKNTQSQLTLDDVKKVWRDILETFKARRLRVLGAHLSNGEPISCKHSIIEVRFKKSYNFSRQNLQRPENNKKVEEIFSQVLKEKIRIIYSLEKDEEDTKVSTEDIIKNTFGEEIVDIIDE